MTSRSLTWQQAVLCVLRETNAPLHYTEVEREIIRRDLKSKTATSQATTNSALRNLLSKSGKNGVREIYNQKGVYAIASLGEKLNQQLREEEAAENGENRITVKALGLFWERNRVNWNSGNKLLGQQSENAITVDFADQDGVYILHDRRDIMYVGKTYTPTARYGLYKRLQDHHQDPRKTVYWDAFSWFGFKPVSAEGKLGEAPNTATLKSVIDVIEAIFIEALMPRLNQQSGEGMADARRDSLYLQVASD